MTNSLPLLESTHARIATEQAYTFSNHVDLWKEWGNSINSLFKEIEQDMSDAEGEK